MPHVILLGKPNFWQMLTGDRSRHTTATVWTIIAYDPEPVSPIPPNDRSALLKALPPLAPLSEAHSTKDLPTSTN